MALFYREVDAGVLRPLFDAAIDRQRPSSSGARLATVYRVIANYVTDARLRQAA